MESPNVSRRYHWVGRPLYFKGMNWAIARLRKWRVTPEPFHTEALISIAKRKTGLTDFGGEEFVEALRRLLDSCENEADLNPFGQFALSSQIIQLLINRLHIQRDRLRRPALAQETIKSPIFITGFPRTGTTLLHRLLALDQETFAAPRMWEIMFPSPPGANEEQRIMSAERNVAWFHRLAPGFRKIHPVSAKLPEECMAILSHTFLSDQFDTMFKVPSYQEWLETQDMVPAYQYHFRFLQHLQYGRPNRRFILKGPAHMRDIESLLSVYPDAYILKTQREPMQVLPSVASLVATLRSVFSDSVDPVAVGAEMVEYWGKAFDRFRNALMTVSSDSFTSIDFFDLAHKPITVMRKLYTRLGHTLSVDAERRIRIFLESYPRKKYGDHVYSLEDFGLDPIEVRKRFGPSMRDSVPSEG